MDDPAHVRLVDAHAKRDRGADNPGVVAEKLFLVPPPFRRVEPGVIRPREESAAGERFGGAFSGGPARAIDDAALMLALAHEIDDLLQRLIFRDDAVGEVRAVEAGDED